ncbi:MAG: DUF1553 domain-containing protein, partial [Planctomycetales bacterium]|nr:DUF1553 domain-containing protein [Planctomycetales bacterium]
HKFDPIPTRDYYRIYAAFAATQMAERPAPFLSIESRKRFEEGQAFVQQMLEHAVAEKNKIKDKQETAARAWFKEHNLEYLSEEDRKDLPDEQKPPRYVGLDYVDEGQLKVREQDEWIWNRRLERYQPMAQSVYNGPDVDYQWNGARKLRMTKKVDAQWQPNSFILGGGALTARGDAVDPGVLSATRVPVRFNTKDSVDPYVIDSAIDGRRTALAKWVVDPDNPLAARVIVNRIWQQHFGRGLAGNPNNFGAKGAKPTHPELLDWLAADLIKHGWKIKRLHRLITTSHTYQQSTQHSVMDSLRTEDPSNNMLAYMNPRRLTAEELRDSLLFVSGELNGELGGLPIMPEINMEVALQPRMIQFSLAPAYQPSPTPESRNRRTIYAYRVRGQADPFLELFNQPTPNESCEYRDSAAVTPQSFTLLNSDMITDRSIAFALRLQDQSNHVADQITNAFKQGLGRRPADSELSRMNMYVEEMLAYHRQHMPVSVDYPVRITRSLVEEFSGKPFEYEEILPAFQNYKRDKKPADVDASTRALADMCLLLFNSNEFIYVY